MCITLPYIMKTHRNIRGPKYHKIISHKKDLSKVMFSLLFSILLWPCYGTMMYRQECSHGQAWLQPEQCECREAEV